MTAAESFHIRTYGCQMNVHDSDKLTNLLHHSGWLNSETADEAGLLIINTCSIREKAENRLYSDLGALRDWKEAAPGRILGVGGCVAQQVGDALLRRFSHLDFVFGTHNLKLVPSMVDSASRGQRTSEVEENRSLARFDLPERHPELAADRAGAAFVTVMEGCDMFCSFCIVPRTRGREISRPAESILREARRLAEEGICEITLLGQTVNAYGRHDRRRAGGSPSGGAGFAELLAELDSIPGIRRIRYTSPHPLFFDASLIQAHASLKSLCPHVHLPVQSGSNRILEAMRRRYRREQYLEIVRDLRAAVPQIALTTDLIVGFPGERREDFQATLDLVREVGFVDHYGFKYSPRPDTTAIRMGDPVAPEEAQERLQELQGLQRELSLAHHRSRVGGWTEVLVEGQSRAGHGQFRGRDPSHRLVNLAADEEKPVEPISAGQIRSVELVEATPHSLIGIVRA